MGLPKGRHHHGDTDHGTSRKFQGRESFLASRISLFVDENKPRIPDGGWGWFVVLACTFINCVADGITCTFGLLHIDFLREFEASNSATAWIGSLYIAVPLVAGPIGSALVDRYGCKSMTIVGALVSTSGFIMSTFARNIIVMYITFGFIGGIGLALCYVTAVVSIAFWFEKRRTLALGLAATGCGFGTVMYSPLITVLSREYGWRGTVLILAGLFANMVVCGLLMREPDWVLQEERERMKANEEIQNEVPRKSSTSEKKTGTYHSVVNLPTYFHNSSEVPHEVLQNLSNNKHVCRVIRDNPVLLSKKSHSVTQDHDLVKDCNQNLPLLRRGSNKSKPHLHHSYLRIIGIKKDSLGSGGNLWSSHKHQPTALSCPNILENQVNSPDEDKEWYSGLFSVVKDLTSFDLFADLHFLIISIATIVINIWFIVPPFYLANHMKEDCGYADYQTSTVFSILGGTNVLGMVILGWLGDKINTTKLYAICLICSGGSIATMKLFTSSYPLLIISSGAFGLFYASCHSLTPAILADLVPLDTFARAYGLSLLCQGIGKLAGPPLAGMLIDFTQSYSQSFYQAAFWITMSGILIGTVPFTKTRKLCGL